mmetsp:Transcript_52452/g.170321  ORF Transcript_52452/g.170321 Transcript_52452/m.170321 type:complete len:220 (-) Transcript_52452:1196-1855(-)
MGQRQAQSRRHHAARVLVQPHVATALHIGDVRRHGGISADAVPIHEFEQLRLREMRRRLRLVLRKPDVLDKHGLALSTGPSPDVHLALVRSVPVVHIEPAPRNTAAASCRKKIVADLQLHLRLLEKRIGRDGGEEMCADRVEQLPASSTRTPTVSAQHLHGCYRRVVPDVGAVHTRGRVAVAEQRFGGDRPGRGVGGDASNRRLQVECRRILVRLCARV